MPDRFGSNESGYDIQRITRPRAEPGALDLLPLTVQEIDGSPVVDECHTLKVSNGRLTKEADGIALLTIPAAAEAALYNNLVIVDPSGEGHYTTLTAALAAISDASSTNRYGVVVMPGIYDESDIELKDCVDIIAYVPGTVTFKPASAAAAILKSTAALTYGITIDGLILELAIGSVYSCLELAYAGAANATIRRCKFIISSAATNGYPLTTGHTSGTILVDDCLLENNKGGRAMSAAGAGTLVVLSSRLYSSAALTGVAVIECNTSTMSVQHCELIGGEYAIKKNSSAVSVTVSNTYMTAPLGPDVTNTVEVPSNAYEYSHIVVVDGNGGGNYTTLTAALAAITDASSTNRYGVVLLPGIYDEFDIELKDCVDIMAQVPGTVKFKPTTAPSGYGIFSRMDGALATGVNVTGIDFEVGISFGKYCLILSYAGALNATFRSCKFVVSSGTSNYSAGVAYHTSGVVLFEDCIFENNVSTTVMAALGCAANGGTVVVSKCRLYVNSTATGSQPIEVEGSGLSVYHCELLGGEYSIAVQVSAATVYVALTRMTANIGPNVTNSIGIPHNATAIAQPTTSSGSATFVQNSGNAVNDASTFDGYTLKQVVKALRDLGLLA